MVFLWLSLCSLCLPEGMSDIFGPLKCLQSHKLQGFPLRRLPVREMFLGDGGVMEDLRGLPQVVQRWGGFLTWHVKNEHIVDITHENRR